MLTSADGTLRSVLDLQRHHQRNSCIRSAQERPALMRWASDARATAPTVVSEQLVLIRHLSYSTSLMLLVRLGPLHTLVSEIVYETLLVPGTSGER